MQFIADFWWLWLVIAVIFMALAITNHIQSMKNLNSSRFSDNNFFNRFGLTATLWGVGSLAWVTFGVSVIIHLVTYLKHA